LSDAQSGNQIYDIPGRRFHAESSYALHILVDGMATF
jgi:hypothetical protein